MAASNSKSMTPVAVVLSCWLLALCLGIFHGPSLGESAERKVALEETTELRSKVPRLLAWFSSLTGASRVAEATRGPKTALYDTKNTVGEVLATSANLTPEPPAIPDPIEEEEEATPSPLLEPKRVLVMGASSIQYELGRALERAYKEREGVEVKRFGRHSTGLARPDYFDWPKKAQELADEFQPDLVIAQYGGNDGQGVTNHAGKGLARFGTDEWEEIYSSRVTGVVQAMRDRGATVIVLGMPVMKKKTFRKKIERINTVTRAAVEAAGATFVDTVPMTADEKGAYRRRAKVDGRLRIIRATDGIHMTAHGAAMVSREVIALLEARGAEVSL
jgi:hypothetical protein